jgi:hypothetical protein
MSQANVEIVREVMSLVEDARNGDISHLEEQITRLHDLVTDGPGAGKASRAADSMSGPAEASSADSVPPGSRCKTQLVRARLCWASAGGRP